MCSLIFVFKLYLDLLFGGFLSEGERLSRFFCYKRALFFQFLQNLFNEHMMCEAKKSMFFISLRFLQTKLNLLGIPCFFACCISH